ncbi:hypothetical protein EUTSA_v10012028mg [Eutrema salsugineum]|uniref:Pectinesterase inhibitor domain-containing protein n=1 Tax=Eutrema salsugineum TaxID=72664 RepID=V4KLG9_EUTSA|nr:hypothetical protein EUTSA_v10012028mg [Eutrema salsugineum]
MVVYVKNKFLLIPLVVLFLLVASSYGRFSMKLSLDEVSTICSRHTKPSFCLEFFKSITPGINNLNISDTAKFLINYVSRDALEAQKQFKALVNSTIDPQSKNVYAQCSDNYGSSSLNDLNDAIKALAAKDYATLNIEISAAMTNGVSCTDELPSVEPISPQLQKKISDFNDVSENCISDFSHIT